MRSTGLPAVGMDDLGQPVAHLALADGVPVYDRAWVTRISVRPTTAAPAYCASVGRPGPAPRAYGSRGRDRGPRPGAAVWRGARDTDLPAVARGQRAAGDERSVGPRRCSPCGRRGHRAARLDAPPRGDHGACAGRAAGRGGDRVDRDAPGADGAPPAAGPSPSELARRAARAARAR